ncbi:MAG: CHC2 zinc finger domain-containing protein [Candidatus Omnitrophota bacterium]
MVAINEETYWNDELCRYENVPAFPYPTEIELLRIFREGKEIIPEKIYEWKSIREKLFSEEVMPVLRKISDMKDSFSRWFCKEAYKSLVNPGFMEAVEQLARLDRLKILTTNTKHSKNIINFEQKKETAKQTPILSLYSFQKLRKLGSRYAALCPFHNEKTSSFFIYPNNTFHCFGCQAHGDVIDFIKLVKGCSFNEAIGQLAGVA